jgi:uncharacterized protein YciI
LGSSHIDSAGSQIGHADLLPRSGFLAQTELPPFSLRVMRFVVIREQGQAWDRLRAMREQDYWPEHVVFVNRIVDEGRMLLGGPLGEVDQHGKSADPTEPVGTDGTYRTLIVVEADNERELMELVNDDPWSKHRVLETRAIYRWEMLVGEIASA